ncbi:MAG: GNAT family N-acetyltransferase [Gammaproteobacteria bacterium]|nr:GNAT family N-acetyltransferase [Gammaproteobacteria bacterium]
MSRIRRAVSKADLKAARKLRHEVFVEEQGIPAAHEQDGLDDNAVHVIAVEGDRVIGTGRLILKSHQTGIIGRIAVDRAHRGAGLATELMEALETLAAERGMTTIELLPHDYLEGFYCRLGYRTVPGGDFMVGRHRVLTMTKPLPAGD